MHDADPLAEYHRRAELGESAAQLELAWEYFRGDGIPKDINAAIKLLRRMEMNAPELARFNIAKMKYLEGDASFSDVIREDCIAGFGPSLWLMATAVLKKGDPQGRSEAITYYREAARNGHLLSEFLAWKLGKLGLWTRLATAIRAHRALFRALAIRWRDANDIRILE